MSDLHTKTIHELAVLMEQGACTSEQIVRDLLDKIQKVDSTISAYLSVNGDSEIGRAHV